MTKLSQKIANIFFGDIISRAFAFITSVYLARMLGTEGYGLITIAMAFLGYFVFFSDFGLFNLGVREIAKPVESRIFNAKDIYSARVGLALILFALSFAIVPLFNFSSIQTQLIRGFIYALGAHAFFLEWHFNGKQKYGVIAAARIINNFVYLMLVVLFIGSVNNILFIPYYYTFSLSLAVIFTFILAVREKAFHVPFNGFKRIIELLKATSKIGSGLFFSKMIQLYPPIVIGIYLTAEDAGLFGAAFKMIIIIMLFDRLIVNLLIPNLSYQWSTNKEWATESIQKVTRLMLTAGSVLALGLSIGAPDFTVWIFGSDYTFSASIVTILCVLVFFTFQNSIYTLGLVAIGEDKTFLKSTAVSGIISFILITLAAKYSDLIGVTIAVALSEVLITAISWYWFSKFIHLKNFLATFITISVSALVYWASTMVELFPWIEAILSSVVLFAILYLLQVIRKNEIQWISSKLLS